jgi:hypothetical protein
MKTGIKTVNQKKYPRKYNKILEELEERSPRWTEVHDLAYCTKLLPREVAQVIRRKRDVFKKVEIKARIQRTFYRINAD